GAIEDASEHPIAQAIAKGAIEELDIVLPPVEDFRNVEGRGVTGVVEGRALLVGRQSLLDDWSIAEDPEILRRKQAAEAEGKTAVLVAWDGALRGLLVVADTVKPTSSEAIAQFREIGLSPILLTGDNETVARRIAAEVGITDV